MESTDTGCSVYLNSRQAAAFLGVCTRTLGNLRRRRVIPFVKLGRLVRFRRDALESALKSYSVENDFKEGESCAGSEHSRMGRKSKNWPRLFTRRYPKTKRNPSGVIKYCVDLGPQGSKKRDRRKFDTAKERDEFVEQARAARNVQGQIPFFLPHEIQSQAVAFYRFIQQHNLGDFNSVRQHYEKDIVPYLTAPSLAEITQQMLEEMDVAKEDRDKSIDTAKGIANEFVRCLGGERKITDIRLKEVSDFVFKCGRAHVGRTKKNRRAIVSQLFNFAIRNEFAEKNLASRLPLPRVVHKKQRALTVDECSSLLGCATEFGMMRFATAVLLTGVRTEETQATPRDLTREEEGFIYVPEYAAKMGVARDVPINETAAAWYPLCDPADNFLADKRGFDERFEAWRKAAGIVPWPRNALRRTFASYHYATFDNAQLTAKLIGHDGGTRTLFKHYIVYVSKKEAKRFWTLRPPSSSEIGRVAA
jgi:excisionase family DNA binding protein